MKPSASFSQSLKGRNGWILLSTFLTLCFGIVMFSVLNPPIPELLPSDMVASYDRNTLYIYEVNLDSSGKEVHLTQSNPPASAPAVAQQLKETALRLKADLRLHAKKEEKGFRVFGRLNFKDLIFRINGENQTLAAEELPFIFRVDENGHITKYFIHQDKLESHGFLIRELLAVIELPFPTDRKAVWSAEENSFLRSWPTYFRLTHLTASEAEFIKIYDPSKIDAKIKIDGSARFRYDRARRQLKDIQGQRHLDEQLLDGRQIGNDLSYSVHLRDVSRLRSSDLSLFPSPENPLAKGPRFVGDKPRGQEQFKLMEMRSFVSILAGSQSEDLQNELKTLDISRTDKDSTKLFQKLDALFRVNPSSAEAFRALLDNLDFRDQRLELLMQAMITASTPEVQSVIRRSILDNQDNPRKAERMLTELSFMKYPSKDTEDFFQSLAASGPESVRRKAEYALSNIAHFVKDEDKARAILIYKDLSEKLDASVKAQDRVGILHHMTLLGNIGLTEQLQALTPFVTSGDVEIRDTALQALRFVDSDPARALLIQGLSDPDEKVREGTVFALGFTAGTEATLQAYRVRLYQEKNETVLRTMLTHLQAMADHSQAARETIQNFLASCGKPSICDYASSLQASR